MRKSIIVLTVLIPLLSKAQQQQDSLALGLKKSALKNYPAFRPFNIEYSMNRGSDYSTKVLGAPFETGHIVRYNRLKISTNMPLYRKRNFTLTGGINYTNEEIGLNDVSNTMNLKHQENLSYHLLGLSLTGVWRDSLWNKPLIITGGLNSQVALTNGIHKFSGIASGMLLLQASKEKRLGVGLAGIISASAQFPIVPVFSYWRKLSPSWELDFMLPSRLYFRKSDFYKGWLTIGTELNRSNLLLKLDNNFLQGDYEQRTTSLRTGAAYERRLNSFLLVGVKAGIQNTLSSRLGEINAKSSDYISETKTDASPYLTFTLSFAPFIKKR